MGTEKTGVKQTMDDDENSTEEKALKNLKRILETIEPSIGKLESEGKEKEEMADGSTERLKSDKNKMDKQTNKENKKEIQYGSKYKEGEEQQKEGDSKGYLGENNEENFDNKVGGEKDKSGSKSKEDAYYQNKQTNKENNN